MCVCTCCNWSAFLCLFHVRSRELMCGFEQRQAYLLSVSDDSVLSLGRWGLWESERGAFRWLFFPTASAWVSSSLKAPDCNQERKLGEMMCPSCCVDRLCLPVVNTTCTWVLVCDWIRQCGLLAVCNVGLCFNMFFFRLWGPTGLIRTERVWPLVNLLHQVCMQHVHFLLFYCFV